MASGLSIGLAIGLGGIAAVFLGAIADAVDLETALWVCAAAPLAGVVLTLLLLRPDRGTRSRRKSRRREMVSPESTGGST